MRFYMDGAPTALEKRRAKAAGVVFPNTTAHSRI